MCGLPQVAHVLVGRGHGGAGGTVEGLGEGLELAEASQNSELSWRVRVRKHLALYRLCSVHRAPRLHTA